MKTKKNIGICIDNKLYELLNEKITNKSKYIEWLIYQDLLKNYPNEDIKKITIL